VMSLATRTRDAIAAFRATKQPVVAADSTMPKPDAVVHVRIVERPWATVPIDETRLLNDDTVASVYTLYKDTLLGGGWHWEGDDAKSLTDYTDACEQAHGLPQLLDEIAAAPFQRFAVAEVIWQTGGTWVPISYRVLPHINFNVTINQLGEAESIRAITTAGVQDLPLQQALWWPHRPTHLNPLGSSYYDSLQEVVNFKRRGDESLIRFVERFAGGILVGSYAEGTPEAEQQEMYDSLVKMRANSVIMKPYDPEGGNTVEIIEPTGQGTDIAIQAINMFERRIARRVLGSVLGVFESQFGTRAQAETHLNVMKSVIQTRQKEVEEPFDRQVVQRVVAWNFGPGARDLRWKLNPPKLQNLKDLATLVADLSAAGFLDPSEDGNTVRSQFDYPERANTGAPVAVVVAEKEVAARQAGQTSEANA
jgi:hypothetical protein